MTKTAPKTQENSVTLEQQLLAARTAYVTRQPGLKTRQQAALNAEMEFMTQIKVKSAI